MTTADVIRNFVNGYAIGHASSQRLRIDGNRLFNYATCIAERTPDGNIIVNLTKYSPTTSKHQNKLMRLLPPNTITLHDIPMGAHRLI